MHMAKMYRPLTKGEQQDRATRLAQKKCPSCPHDYPDCKECIWYLVMNAMIGEEEF